MIRPAGNYPSGYSWTITGENLDKLVRIHPELVLLTSNAGVDDRQNYRSIPLAGYTPTSLTFALNTPISTGELATYDRIATPTIPPRTVIAHFQPA